MIRLFLIPFESLTIFCLEFIIHHIWRYNLSKRILRVAKVDNKEFQKRALESFTRLEEGQVELKEGYVKLEKGQTELKETVIKLDEKIDFVHDDLNTKIEMIANAVKQLVEKMDALVERMITKEEYERRFRDLENRIRELEQK